MQLTKKEIIKIANILVKKGAQHGLELTGPEKFGYYDFTYHFYWSEPGVSGQNNHFTYRRFDMGGRKMHFELANFLCEEELKHVQDGFNALKDDLVEMGVLPSETKPNPKSDEEMKDV